MTAHHLLTPTITKIDVNHVASTAALCSFGPRVRYSDSVIAAEGYCVVARVLDSKDTYNMVEHVDGAFGQLNEGDILVGVLGERKALRGYSGCVPPHIEKGDVLHILNLGGIIGLCTSEHPDLGAPIRVEILGAAVDPAKKKAEPARIGDYALPHTDHLVYSAPLVIISGTSMHAGKTLAACKIIEDLTAKGYTVAAGKLTGASLVRDISNMKDAGAVAAASFTDMGMVSTTGKSIVACAKGLIEHLNKFEADIIVLELGDGFIGYYGVDELLMDYEIGHFTAAHVVAASDLAGAWAADVLFNERFEATITCFTGPVTDNNVGTDYISQVLRTAAHNARTDAAGMMQVVNEAVSPRVKASAGAQPFSGMGLLAEVVNGHA